MSAKRFTRCDPHQVAMDGAAERRIFAAASEFPMSVSRTSSGGNYTYPPEDEWDFWIRNTIDYLRLNHAGFDRLKVEQRVRTELLKRLQRWRDGARASRTRTSSGSGFPGRN